MTYPIDTEVYIAAIRQKFGPNEAAEEAYREIIPLVNDAYAAGLHGEDGYPLEIDVELCKFAEASGRPLERIQANPLLPPLIDWCTGLLLAKEKARAAPPGWPPPGLRAPSAGPPAPAASSPGSQSFALSW